MTDRKTCRMCGGPAAGARGTKEHVFADWLLNEFKLQKHRVDYSPVELLGGPSLQLSIPNHETPKRGHAMKGLVLGTVCGDCNNGWMSGLEGRAKPDLLRLIGDADAQPGDSIGLALWAQKTAYTLSQFLDPPVGRVPRAHGLWPRDHSNGLPQGVAVFHQQMPAWRMWFSAPLTFVVGGDEPDRIQSRYRSAYRYMVQLGHAMFMVQFWPDSTATLLHDRRWCRILLANGDVQDEPDPAPTPPGTPLEFNMVLSTRYETRIQRAPLPLELCQCGSGLNLADCWPRRHRERITDNWGWM